MEKKQDLRITKTYMALTRAFLEMMQETPFEDIKVKELCDRALVRKSTFYKHFADKYELMAYVVREAQRRFDSEIATGMKEQSPAEYYAMVVSCVFRFMHENEGLVHSAIKSNSFSLILSILSEEITPSIQQKLREDKKRGYKMPASPEVMAPFFVGAVMESIKKWLICGKQIEEGQLAEQLTNLIMTVYRAENA